MRVNKPLLLPKIVNILTETGENIKLARLRRKLSAEQVAERANISRPTLRSIENGAGGVAMGAYAQVLLVLGMEKDLLKLAGDDPLGRKLQDANLLVKERAPKKKKQIAMAKTTQKRTIQVYADWLELRQPTIIGSLHTTQLRGKEIFSFEYNGDWLKSGRAQNLDPDLQLYSGKQYLAEGKSNFGIFLDSSPDRWGRVLMDRREAAMARKEDRKSKTLFETDYLLGVFDSHRMGALRFKESEEGPFLNDNKEMATPPWTSIRELEQATLHVEDDEVDNDEKLKWLNMLMAPGSSLGGARPKASVLDLKGQLWIAKFPSKNDNRDIGAWEMVVYELALLAGLNVSESRTGTFYSKQHTFLTKRFDRNAKGERIHFASAMTLLGQTDGANFQSGASYLDLVEFISKNGANVASDLEELWRRIVFYICVRNTDDHLRNHGFLLTERGWLLSPAYDINPVETGTGLSLNISENDNALHLDLAKEVAPYFRVSGKRVNEIIKIVKKSVAQWRPLAEKFRISKTEREIMAKAFVGE